MIILCAKVGWLAEEHISSSRTKWFFAIFIISTATAWKALNAAVFSANHNLGIFKPTVFVVFSVRLWSNDSQLIIKNLYMYIILFSPAYIKL